MACVDSDYFIANFRDCFSHLFAKFEQDPDDTLLVTLDPNDENFLSGILDDPNTGESNAPAKEKLNISRHSHEEPPSSSLSQEAVKDFFNISNDEYYNPKLTQDVVLKPNVGGNLIHSIPAVKLHKAFFPTDMTLSTLRHFHRPFFIPYNTHVRSFRRVLPLARHIKHKAKLRLKERQASGGGEMFFMRTIDDLSGKDGEIILAEYSEEYPPLIMQVGMATKIVNYFKRKPKNDSLTYGFNFGELAYAHTSPFLGNMSAGQCVRAFENNLFRSPIYEHDLPETDFLIIHTQQHFYIREVQAIFTVGQLLPLTEVPSPNSKTSITMSRNLLMVFICRLFQKCAENPRRIKMEDIRKAFPTYSESMIRKHLKKCADFNRIGDYANLWVLKRKFRLPTEEEIRAMISPEQCCAFYSMLAAEQRLKDAGYGEKSLFSSEHDEEETQTKMEDEVKAAPWNTTRAFISAMRGKGLLQLTGCADPTGCGEGFSYVRVSNKPKPSMIPEFCYIGKKNGVQPEGDLRYLSIEKVKALLSKFNVPEEELSKLSRWKLIDVLRTLSTKQAIAGNESWIHYARGMSLFAAYHEHYREECQRLFELQNRILGSKEILPNDEDTGSADKSDIKKMGETIVKMLSNKKTHFQLIREKKDSKRNKLKNLMSDEDLKNDVDKHLSSEGSKSRFGRVLKIHRTFRSPDGHEFVKTETIQKQAIIDAYIHIKNEEKKLEIRKERRKLMEQLRRRKRKAERQKFYAHPKKKRKIEITAVKTKCGACGATGHMRTNKFCPLNQLSSHMSPAQVTMTEEVEDAFREGKTNLENESETRAVISRKLAKNANEILPKALVPSSKKKWHKGYLKESCLTKIPKRILPSKKKRHGGLITDCDYLDKSKKTVNYRITDPLVTLSMELKSVLDGMRDLPGTQAFFFPAQLKTRSYYQQCFSRIMDLQTMKEKLSKCAYKTHEEFLNDVIIIVQNSIGFHGENSSESTAAQNMLSYCLKKFSGTKSRPQKAINPLFGDKNQVAFSYILEMIVSQDLKSIPESWPFHKSISTKTSKDNSDALKVLLDLDTLLKNIQRHKYTNRKQFLVDIELLYENSMIYNGFDSQLTRKALEIVDACKGAFTKHADQLSALETAIGEISVDDTKLHDDLLSSDKSENDSDLDFDDSLEMSAGDSDDSISWNKFLVKAEPED